jgi:hypothetical protein
LIPAKSGFGSRVQPRTLTMNPRFLTLLLLSFFQVILQAQTVTLKTTTMTPEAGQTFILQIQANSRQVARPGILDIPGIEVQSQSQSTNMSIVNGQVSSVTTFTYRVVAEKEGTIAIPSIELNINGKPMKTNALTLNVKKGIPRPPGLGGTKPNQTDNPAFPANLDDSAAFLKVVPVRDEIYAGETVEVKIKAYLDAGMPIVNFTRELNLQGEDFIFQPTVGPDVQLKKVRGRRAYHFNQEKIGGRTYNVLTYKTTITAVKPGTFTLAPIDYSVVIQMPRKKRPQRTQRRSTLDSIFGSNPFDDPFFDSVMTTQKKELRLQSKPEEVRVLPLPSEGRPSHYTGAIGRFSLEVKADKTNLQVDEALKITAQITGHGNFERITELDSVTDSKWKAYPPKIEFNSADPMKISGEKTFDYTYIAAEAATESPAIQFAYFDPEAKKYVNLTGKRTPVTVTGTAVSSLTNQDLAALADQVAAPDQNILASISASSSFFQGSHSSWLGSGSMLAFNGLAAATALGLVAWQWRKRERPLTPKQRRRLLETERAQLTSDVLLNVDPVTLQERLTRWLALQHHLSRQDEIMIDDATAARATVSGLPESSSERAKLDDFLSWAAAHRWSGKAEVNDESFAERRQGWVQAAQSLLKTA